MATTTIDEDPLQIPPKLPDNQQNIQNQEVKALNTPIDAINSPLPSFKDKLLENNETINIIANPIPSSTFSMDTQDHETETSSVKEDKKFPITVHITLEDMQRIYHPWKLSLIIKLQGKIILHQYLKQKIQEL